MTRPNDDEMCARKIMERTDRSSECWLWIGAKTSKGYGSMGVRGRIVATHRVAWSLAYGPIPPSMHVLHRCDMPACVRPDHLFLGTHADNMADKVAKGRGRTDHLWAGTTPKERSTRVLRGHLTRWAQKGLLDPTCRKARYAVEGRVQRKQPRAKRRAVGGCQHCPSLAVEGRTRCSLCSEKAARMQRDARTKR